MKWQNWNTPCSCCSGQEQLCVTCSVFSLSHTHSLSLSQFSGCVIGTVTITILSHTVHFHTSHTTCVKTCVMLLSPCVIQGVTNVSTGTSQKTIPLLICLSLFRRLNNILFSLSAQCLIAVKVRITTSDFDVKFALMRVTKECRERIKERVRDRGRKSSER